jgi:hypothetical protein
MEAPVARVQAGIFSDDLATTFRIILQEIFEAHANRIMYDARAVAGTQSEASAAAVGKNYRTGLESVRQWSEEDKAEYCNTIVAAHNALPKLYEHAYLLYAREVYRDVRGGNTPVGAPPPHVRIHGTRTMLYTFLRTACTSPDALSGEFLLRMRHADKAFFIESVVRRAFYELLLQGGMLGGAIIMNNNDNGGGGYRTVQLQQQPPPPPAMVAPAAAAAVVASVAASSVHPPPPTPNGGVLSEWGSAASVAPTTASTAVASTTASNSTFGGPATTTTADAAAAGAIGSLPLIDTATINLNAAASNAPSESTFDVLGVMDHTSPHGRGLPEPEIVAGRQPSQVDSIDLPNDEHSFTDDVRRLMASTPMNPSDLSSISPSDSVSQVAAAINATAK